MINLTAIYILWLREIKRLIRTKSRIIGMFSTPLLFLGLLALGFRNISIPGMPLGIDYITFIVPGIISMGLLFSSIFAGVSVIWDREFGFLKEIMIAPVSRLSIVLGRMAGGSNISLIQGITILFIAIFAGFRIINLLSIPLSILFMFLISINFIGLGLIFASKMRDMQGFNLIMNFIIFPIFFLSGALFPIDNIPEIIRPIIYINPLTYGVDGLRGVLINASIMPVMLDFIILLFFSIIMAGIGAYLFNKSEII